MIKRQTWIMVILLAALAGLAYYMQAVPDNFMKKAFDSGKTLTPNILALSLVPPGEGLVSGIEIADAEGNSVILKHEPTVWTVSVNGKDPIAADQTAVEQAASQAQGLHLLDAAIKPTTTDLSGFGLDKPVYRYKVTTESGKIFTFKIGKPTIINDGYYLQKEDGTIAVVEKLTMDALLNLLKQPPFLTTATPSPAPVTETPTATITAPPAPTTTSTATPGA